MTLPAIYHYTCDHGAEGVRRDGLVKPNPHTGVAWFTDLATPDIEALGLTSQILECDRTAHRFRLTHLAGLRRATEMWSPSVLSTLSGDPTHWWVAFDPMPAAADPIPTEEAS